ncbi:uncharacterized protein LOC142317618 [Lycorma delicatula]|uniref:uncharacterized protein LOC142317618 n=1 Tax=Lycorma delicatula TaxID=130591 RepID=UPI003F517C27
MDSVNRFKFGDYQFPGRYATFRITRCNGFVMVEPADFSLVSDYTSPNSVSERFQQFINDLEVCIRSFRKSVILTGDYNSECRELGGIRATPRGYILAAMFDAVGLATHNARYSSTFVGRGRGSVVDFTGSSDGIAHWIKDWQICVEELTSDNLAIMFTVECGRSGIPARRQRWRPSELQAKGIVERVADRLDPARTITHKGLMEEVLCDECSRGGRPEGPAKKRVHWWTDEIATRTAATIAARRKIQRATMRAVNDLDELLVAYRQARKSL